MLQKKALFLVTAESEINPLVSFARVFKQKYNVDVDVIYIKDILKYEVFPVSIEGMGLNIGANYAFKEYRELEEKTVKKFAPSSTAASFKDFGIAIKVGLSINVDIANPIDKYTRLNPQILSYNPKFITNENIGCAFDWQVLKVL